MEVEERQRKVSVEMTDGGYYVDILLTRHAMYG